jgi:hypothetical protein
VTWTSCADVKVHDNVALPEFVRLVGLMVQLVLFVVRLIVPVKPFTAVAVIVEVPATFALTVTDVGLALIVKSLTVKVTVVAWDRLPLVPVTVT